MHKDDGLKILVIHKDHKEGRNGQKGRNQVAKKRNAFELMRIDPNAKNISRKEQHRFKTYRARGKNRRKIQQKVGCQFKALTDQTVQHAFGGFIDQVFFCIIKIIDDVPSGDDQSGTKNDNKQQRIEQDLPQGNVRGQNVDGRQVLRQGDHQDIVASND